MSVKELVALWTDNNRERSVLIKFNGWLYSPSEVVRELRNGGYTVKTDCMTYRHHARVYAHR